MGFENFVAPGYQTIFYDFWFKSFPQILVAVTICMFSTGKRISVIARNKWCNMCWPFLVPPRCLRPSHPALESVRVLARGFLTEVTQEVSMLARSSLWQGQCGGWRRRQLSHWVPSQEPESRGHWGSPSFLLSMQLRTSVQRRALPTFPVGFLTSLDLI